MKIERYGPVEPGRLYRVEERTRGAAASRPAAAGGDEVSLSEEARLRQELLARLRELPEIREDLVVDIARRLAEGRYQVDIDRLAEAIADEMRLQRR